MREQRSREAKKIWDLNPGRLTPEFMFLTLFFFFFLLFLLFRAASVAHGGSQARGCIGAVTTDLHHSHNNAKSEPQL